MFKHSLQIYFISVLYASILINSGLSEKKWPAKNVPFPEKKCQSLLTNCFCYDVYPIAALVCNNIVDFTRFNRILQFGEIFEVNTTYEITFTGIKNVPAGILQGLMVNRFILDAPDATVDEKIFQGVISLRWYHVRQSMCEGAPDFSFVKDSMKRINIDSSVLTCLGGTYLQNLTAIIKLSFFNNSIRAIESDIFKGTESVLILDLSYNLLTSLLPNLLDCLGTESVLILDLSYNLLTSLLPNLLDCLGTEGVLILDLSYNLLTSLPPNLLDRMVNLTKFVVSHNNLLHVNGLFSVTHPKHIYLDFNNITDADSVLHHNMDRTVTLALASNPISKISVQSFNGKIRNVKFLFLDHCDIRDFNVSHYRFPLQALDLSYNLIEEVSNQEIDIGYNLELDLIGNQIRKFDATISSSMKRLYLSENKLQILNTTLQLTQMDEVQVARNQLQYLTNQDLRGVHNTYNLEFQQNQISRIDTGTFAPITNDLHYLDLSYNLITSLNRSVRMLSQLKLLNLTHNLIQTFASDEFTGLNELSELYLQYNKIQAIGQLQYLEKLQYLVITHNSVELITPEQVPRKLRFIYLAGNPLKCVCNFQPFLLWLNASDSPAIDIDLCLHQDTENSLHRLQRCPSMCSCSCANNGNVHFMYVDCSSQNLTVVPPFLRNDFLDIQNNTTIFQYRNPVVIDQNVHPSLHIEDYALGINLENNNLEFDALEKTKILPNLLQLYLADNKLKRLPMHMIDNLRRIQKMSLSGNPWDCDCDALRFKKWLTFKYDVVQDINNTRCGISNKGESKLNGRVIWTLTDLDICPADIGLIVSVSFGILTLLLVALATKVLYTKYELNIKVYLYSRGFTFVKEEDLDHDKKFDAFISFSNHDGAFVRKEIISEIEGRDPNIRLCVHLRNFIPGEFIYDNIIWAVQNSKRTVLILTKKFLESEWCLYEFRAAHLQALEDKVHRIIVIKVGDLPEEIDPKIKVYLDSTTYLTWGDKNFWKNLLYVLPTSSTPRDPKPKSIREIIGREFNLTVPS